VEARKNKYLIVLVSLLYLGTTLYFELGHTDIVDGGFGAIHRLFSHDCNGKEVHRPLGKDDQCPVCVRSSQTTPYVESNFCFLSPAFELIGTCVVSSSFLHRERATASVRGPPFPLV
jgi:hypothetical protein